EHPLIVSGHHLKDQFGSNLVLSDHLQEVLLVGDSSPVTLIQHHEGITCGPVCPHGEVRQKLVLDGDFLVITDKSKSLPNDLRSNLPEGELHQTAFNGLRNLLWLGSHQN